jgi:hypothetical protein
MLWLIYVNDLAEDVAKASPTVGLSLFAEDSALLSVARNLANCGLALQPALDAVARWCSKWKVSLSKDKCCYTTFSLAPAEINGKKRVDIYIEGTPLRFDLTPTFLGLKLDGQLSFVGHADATRRKMAHRRQGLAALSSRTKGAFQRVLRTAYVANVRALPDYCCSVWLNFASPSTRNMMEIQQNKCVRLVTGCLRPTRQRSLLAAADLHPLTHVVGERAAVLRERLLRLPEGTPARLTAERVSVPRLKNKTFEARRRAGSSSTQEPFVKDENRQHKGCRRRIASETEAAKKLETKTTGFPMYPLGTSFRGLTHWWLMIQSCEQRVLLLRLLL